MIYQQTLEELPPELEKHLLDQRDQQLCHEKKNRLRLDWEVLPIMTSVLVMKFSVLTDFSPVIADLFFSLKMLEIAGVLLATPGADSGPAGFGFLLLCLRSGEASLGSSLLMVMELG